MERETIPPCVNVKNRSDDARRGGSIKFTFILVDSGFGVVQRICEPI